MKSNVHSWVRHKWTLILIIHVILFCVFPAGIQAQTTFGKISCPPPDVLTGATPNAEDTPKVNGHVGWKNPDCTSCHGDAHLSGFKSPNCPFCHGNIGAPKRPPKLNGGSDHPDKSCTQCHPEVHADLQFESPEDCRACHRYKRNGHQCTRYENYDAVIIGSGGGGLAAATRLAINGLNVVLLEQHFRLGGVMNNFQRYDYRFETSLHAYPGYTFVYFNMLGIADKIVPIFNSVMYRTIYPDFTLDIPSNVNDYRELLKTQFPDDADNIDALFEGFNSMDFATYADMTVLEALNYHGIYDEKLIAVFSITVSFLVKGGIDVAPAELFILMWYVFHNFGYDYIEGGSQAITDALETAIVDASGTIKRNAKVDKIFVEDNQATGVRTTDGVCYNSQYVLSNANAKSTFLEFVGEENLPDEMVDEVVARRPASSPVATLFLGVDADYTSYFPENTHTVFALENYAMQNDDLEKLFCLPEEIRLLVENYTKADPTTAPPGKNAIVVSASLLNYECNDYWNWNRSYEEYQQYKAQLAEVIIGRLEEFLPDISNHIEVMEMASPHTIEQFTLNPNGSWAGWAYEPDTVFEYTDKIETPISGLYMVGAWASGPGQFLVIKSGIDAADLILADEP